MRRHSAVSILAETIARASVDLDDESDSASAFELPALDAINAMAAEVCSRLSHIYAGIGVPHPLRRILRRKRLLRLLPVAVCRSARCYVVSRQINQSCCNQRAGSGCHCGNAPVGLRVSAGPLRVAPQPRRYGSLGP